MPSPASTLGATLLALALTACAGSGPLPEFQSPPPEARPTEAPRVKGEGACRTQVVNVSPRPLDIYYHLGLDSPPRSTLDWNALGILEPGQESVIRADCERRRILVNGYVLGRPTPGMERSYATESRALVEDRLEVIRLQTMR